MDGPACLLPPSPSCAVCLGSFADMAANTAAVRLRCAHGKRSPAAFLHRLLQRHTMPVLSTATSSAAAVTCSCCSCCCLVPGAGSCTPAAYVGVAMQHSTTHLDYSRPGVQCSAQAVSRNGGCSMMRAQTAARSAGKCTQACGTAKQQLLEIWPRHVHLLLHQLPYLLLQLLLSVNVL